MIEVACLADKAAGNNASAIDSGTRRNNKILSNYIPADVDRCLFVTVDATVFQLHGTGDFAKTADPHVFDVSHVHNHGIVSYASHIRRMFSGVIINHRLHALDQVGAVPVKRIYVCKMSG